VFPAAEFDFTRFRGTEPFTLNLAALTEAYWEAGTALAKNIGEVRELILRELAAGRTVIGEFGQAYWLDKRHGFSPNVTASHTYTPGVLRERRHPGAAHPHLRRRQGLRHQGRHAHVPHADGRRRIRSPIKLKQLEFGTSTGRQRMVGWYRRRGKGRRPPLRRLPGPDDQQVDALTQRRVARRTAHLHRLRGQPPAGVTSTCRATRPSGARCKPVYSKHPGWTEDICGVRRFRRPAEKRTTLHRRDDPQPDRGRLPGDRLPADPAESPLPGRRSATRRRSSRTCPPPRS
jgi:adenylosuccinate synthase